MLIWIPALTTVSLTPCVAGGDWDISASLWDGPGPCAPPPPPASCPNTTPQDLSYTGCNGLPTGTSSGLDDCAQPVTMTVGFFGITIQ